MHGDHGPLLGDRRQEDVELRPFGLEIILHVIENTRGAAGCRRDVEPVMRKTRDDAVIHHVAVFPEHHSVPASTRLELQPVIGIEPVQELGCIRADDLDLSESCRIENADARTHRLAFARDGSVDVFAVLQEIARPAPERDVLEHGAVLGRPGVDRRLPDRLEQCTTRRADQRAEGDRRIGRPKCRRADVGDRTIQRLRHDLERGHVRCLALVGRHSGGGVALDVLDGLEAFPDREQDVLDRDVVLKIDERMSCGEPPSRGGVRARRGQ